MASLVLGVVGSAIGGSIGGTFLGLTAAQIGGFVGATIGSRIDHALFSSHQTVQREGPRLSDINLTTSTEGTGIPRLWGRARVGGELLWATRFKETVTTASQTSGGGKGGGGGSTVETTTYSYSISFAVGLSEGVMTRLGRVWADGKPLDLANYTTRFYAGDESQVADPLIEAIEGAGNTPAYRGLAYIVFEDFPLAAFGNRIPQLQFEIWRSLAASDPTALDNVTTGVCLVPGSGEFVLATDLVVAEDGSGGTTGQNKNNNLGVSDLEASIDQLETLLPNCRSVMLVVCWFGDDLRCGSCSIKPKVEVAVKSTSPQTWSVNGVTRAAAGVVSVDGEGRPVFGGTPSDASVVQAIALLRARGYDVHFYPFLLMDIPSGNTKLNPYSNNAAMPGQAPFPWRGRITASPATGFAGAVDKTAAAATQVGAFFGSATAANFAVSGTTVSWTGGADWGLRRMMLHYAKLCAAAGGVSSFLLGSELEALTKTRSSASAYPVVSQLVTLAADVKAILPAAKVSYAANWTEFANHRPSDGSGDVYFHLDPLWSSASVDFVAIDNYAPLSDWRDGATHLDYANGRRITDRDYLDGNVEGGEFFDFTYATSGDRDAQIRTTIADPGGYGEPWIYRCKDLHAWWANAHHDRPSGVRSGSATAWAPESKPIWFTEVGCPAVDRGSNEPNVFVDPKSSESALPYYSRGQRDDLIQRRALEAALNHWTPANGHNPTSSIYAGRMIDTSRLHVWCWDARTFPDFPARTTVWTDAPNWRLGHWLNGRVGLVPLADLVRDLCALAGFTQVDVSDLAGLVTGFLVDRPMSVRDALAPLMLAYQFDAVESDGVIKFVAKARAPSVTLNEDDLVLAGDTRATFSLTRAQETDLPLASRITYIDATDSYAQAAVESRRLVGASNRIASSELPIVMEQSAAQAASDSVLMDAWVMRERASFALAPSQIALDAGDVVTLTAGGRTRTFALDEIADAGARKLKAHATDASIYDLLGGPDRVATPAPVPSFGKPLGVFLDLPLLTGLESPQAPHFAATASPWPGSVLLYRSPANAGFVLDRVVPVPATIGTLNSAFYAGPTDSFDRGNQLIVDVIAGTLESKSELEVLNGANAIAVQNSGGDWEVVQFVQATLIAPKRYKLTQLLRGQVGTEGAMRSPVAAGARVVVLDGAPVQTGLTLDQRTLTTTWRYGPNGQNFSAPSFVEETRAFAGVGLRPLSPAHVRRKRIGGFAGGDDVISWKRRTRLGGDDWAQTEVPLAEASEAYEVDIMSGSTVLRTLVSSTPSVTYTYAQQQADWGGGAAPNALVVRVYQLSSVFGRGAKAEETVYLGVWW